MGSNLENNHKIIKPMQDCFVGASGSIDMGTDKTPSIAPKLIMWKKRGELYLMIFGFRFFRGKEIQKAVKNLNKNNFTLSLLNV